jgi:hypothetical protein
MSKNNMFKSLILVTCAILLTTTLAFAQTPREVSGTVADSTKVTIPGVSVKLTSDQGDSTVVAADVNGRFVFASVKGNKVTLTLSSIGFQTLIKHFSLAADGQPASVGQIILPTESTMLSQVNITGQAVPIKVKEDTVEYNAASYKVRDNAPVEDVLKKLPGVDVDKDGNVSAQGKQITKVRLNGKDYFGGDVQTATKGLPADIIESIQVVDDYGDQANLTGVKTGEPSKILNINIRKDKNYGYSLQATAGDGRDALPKDPGVSNANRYIGTLNYLKFKDAQQISVTGSLNNTNVNTFTFGSATRGGFGGSFGGGGNRGGGGGGGGRGNALRGGGGSSGLATAANGITDAKSLGLNFRDDWGKHISAYGSYSFADNTTYTNSNSLQINRFIDPSTSRSTSEDTSNPINHRFNFNIEYKPDTVNYLKVTPSFSYSRSNSFGFDDVTFIRNEVTDLAYQLNSVSNTTSPNFELNALYNHRFGARGRNFSLNLNYSNAKNEQYDNTIYNYTTGEANTPLNQRINTDSRTRTWGANVSYMEPLSKLSFLELNYAFSHSFTSSDKRTDTLFYTGATPPDTYSDNDFVRDPSLSNNYDYTFTTNRVGLNYRFVDKKLNFTLGAGVQPGMLKGKSVNAPETERKTFNFIPTARFNYRFSTNESLSFNYNGSSSQPSFNELQPVLDRSNALYPVIGNPNLDPTFTNNLSLRYNKFSIETGNVLFTNLSYTQINDRVVSQTTTYPSKFSQAALAANPELKNLQNTNLTSYRNADGYYQVAGLLVFSKPWAERKYTLIFNGNISYNNNIGYSNRVDSNNNIIRTAASVDDFEKNISKNLVFTPGVRLRMNVTDVIDAELNGSYAINRTISGLNSNPLFNQNTNARTLTFGVNGKNYFLKDWTFGYDFTRQVNYGYSVAVTNPNILHLYLERRFLKDNMATLRLQGFDLFNQNRGFSSTDNGNITTQTNTNRLSRYFLLTFTLRLRKFAGKAPSQGPGERGGFRGGDRGPGQGPGGPPGGGGAM